VRIAGHRTRQASINYSIQTADRSTHLKVVTLALIASVVVAIIGFHARSDNIAVASNGPVVKAGKVIQVTSRSRSDVR
jgi:hypothetical protein